MIITGDGHSSRNGGPWRSVLGGVYELHEPPWTFPFNGNLKINYPSFFMVLKFHEKLHVQLWS